MQDPQFEKLVWPVRVGYIPDFGIAASLLLMQLRENFSTFVIPLNCDEGADFIMMLGMRFFVLTGQRYQMAIPPRLTISIVKAAVLRYAETEDAEYYLHPEHLVTTMSATEAEEWQRRLRCMDERQRNADRATLLELGAPRSRHC